MNDPNMKKGVAAVMFGSFFMMFITNTAIAILCEIMDQNHWQEGLHIGVLTGLGLLILLWPNMLYEKKPLGLYSINGG